jgi:cytochrome c peroxidase
LRFLKATLIAIVLSFLTGWAPSFSAATTVRASIEELKFLYKRPRFTVFDDESSYKPQIVTLGKMLFFDPRLSKAKNMSCATCHNPSFGWESPVAKSIGAMNVKLKRHAPTVINLTEANHLIWVGSQLSLEKQIERPIINSQEMNNNFDDLVKRLRKIKSYNKWFRRYFPKQGLTEDTIIESLTTFVRILQSGRAPFDRWIEGDEAAISPQAKTGFELFNNKFGCANCHTGWSFSDHALHEVGSTNDETGSTNQDQLDSYLESGFKTSGLREISSRAPYMHNGAIETLEDVVDLYAEGSQRRDVRTSLIKPFNATPEEKRALIAFLKTLTSDGQHFQTPMLPAD